MRWPGAKANSELLQTEVFAQFDSAGSGVLDARSFLQAMVTAIREHGMPLAQHDMPLVLRRVNDGGQVDSTHLADTLEQARLEAVAEEQEEEEDEEGEAALEPDTHGEQLSVAVGGDTDTAAEVSPTLVQKQAEVKSALQLELEALKAQAQAEARAAALAGLSP